MNFLVTYSENRLQPSFTIKHGIAQIKMYAMSYPSSCSQDSVEPLTVDDSTDEVMLSPAATLVWFVALSAAASEFSSTFGFSTFFTRLRTVSDKNTLSYSSVSLSEQVQSSVWLDSLCQDLPATSKPIH